MVAKDIMTQNVITAGETTPVKSLAKLLMEKSISGAPVSDAGGKMVGVVSEADVLGKKGKLVKDIMSRKVFTVSPDTLVEDIAALMTREKIKRVLVVEGENLAGIVSRADLIRAIAMGDYAPLQTPVYDL